MRPPPAQAAAPHLAPRPPMGFNCWMTRNRDAAGNLVTDTNRFPRGMKRLADYVHGKGLKFGIYEDAGTLTGDGLTDDEVRSQLALWAIMAAPLILSTDVAALSTTSVAIVGNTDVIAVDQDPLGVQAGLVAANGTIDTLAKPLAGGARAVAILNRGNTTTTATTSIAAIGCLGGAGCTFTLKNLWTGTTSTTTGQITGPAGKCVDDANSGAADLTRLGIWPCGNDQANQIWSRPV